MRRFNIQTSSLGIAVLGNLLLMGCSDHKTTTGTQTGNTVPVVVAVSPANGASGVSRTSTIGIRFNTSMDTNSVMGAFHLAGGPEVNSWMDSLGHHQGMGGMVMMNLSHMMQWLDSVEYDGQWHWNTNRDSCWFVADSTLMSDADHMIYLYGAMRSHDGMMMDMDAIQYDGPMIHFHTQP